MDNPITVPLPQNLPTNWTYGQTVAPNGSEVGLPEQFGYNYLMEQVNAAQKAAQECGENFANAAETTVPSAAGNFAILDAEGNLQDSKKSANDFLQSTGVITIKADSSEEPYETYTARLQEVFDAMKDYSAILVRPYPPDAFGAGTSLAVLYRSTAKYGGLQTIAHYTAFDPISICYDNGVWQPMEWRNPNTELGLEYRTTERYNNKPVYVKLIAFGNLPNQAATSVAHGISNIDAFVSVSGSTSDGIFIPTMIYGGGFGDNNVLQIKADRTNITIYAGGNRSGVTANILIRYTKTTD